MVTICVNDVYYTDKRRNEWVKDILEKGIKLFIPPHRYVENELREMDNEQLERTNRIVDDLMKEQTPSQD